MLPATARLRHRKDFHGTVTAGRRAGGRAVVVYLRAGVRPQDGPRVGFVVSRKVGGAVTRNAVRRRLRHLLAARLGELPPGSDVVVRALPASARIARGELASDVDQVLRTLRRRSSRGYAV